MNSSKKTNKWRGDNDDMGLGTAGTGRNPNVVPLTGDGRATGMRMTYIGPGHPLTMLLCVFGFFRLMLVLIDCW